MAEAVLRAGIHRSLRGALVSAITFTLFSKLPRGFDASQMGGCMYVSYAAPRTGRTFSPSAGCQSISSMWSVSRWKSQEWP